MKLPPELANLPAWLKVVCVLVLVLGVCVTGVGAGRAIGERNDPSPTLAARPDLGRFVPAAAVKASDVSTSGCSKVLGADGKTRITVSSCTLTVNPGLVPQELRLTRASDSAAIATMTVIQEIRGQSPPSSTPLPGAAGRVSIPVAGTSPVRVVISCSLQPCVLIFDEQ